MEAKHTPGPWKLDLDNSSYNPTRFHVIDKEYRRIVDVFGTYPRYAGTDEANARLISAAPELLEACEEMLLMHCGGCLCHTCPEKECFSACAYLRFRSVIAKAKGEA